MKLEMKVLFLVVCLWALVICSYQLDLDADEFRRRVDVAPKEARSFLHLRVKRGWGSIRRKLNPLERREEGREAHAAAARAEAARQAQLLRQRQDRECPGQCWTAWGPYSKCTQSCGGGGTETTTRRIKNRQELGGLCADYIAQRGCAGDSVYTRPCVKECPNGGTAADVGCTCAAGWTDPCCETRITCPDPGKPEHGLATPGGAGLHYGTVVQFSCEQGYNLNGPASRTCTLAGTWTNRVPTCQQVSCGDPGTPPNADLEVISGTGFVFSSTVRVTCHTGYRLTGDAVRRCEESGNWAGAAPSCVQIVCPEERNPEHGQVAYPTGWTLNQDAQYTCDSGYVLQGVSTRKCQTNGQWAGQRPSCQQIQCDNLNAPPFGSVAHSDSVNGKTPFGGTAVFSCQNGYTLQGAASLTCSGTSVQGQWSGRVPSCEAVSCGDPGSPTNGLRGGSNFTFGGSVAFKCAPGYYLNGDSAALCEADGQWSSPRPECTECPENKYKENTDVESNCNACPDHSSTNGATAVTTKVGCICLDGYRGNPGGPCVEVTCPPLATPENSIRKTCQNSFNGKCEFECKPGHVVSVGDVIRTCDENGWSGRDLTCTACPVNTYKSAVSQCSACPDNSGTTGTGNEKSGCVCKSGWTGPAGGPCSDVNECQQANGGCAQTCINEIGSYRCECTNAGSVRDADNPKLCNAKNQCAPMERPKNGGLVCYSQQRTNTERCQVKCNNGFEHIASPNAYEECGPSTNWKWNHEIQGKPILACVVSWFEEIKIELDVFYFTDQCGSLTNLQELQIAREFVSFLNSKGVCRVGGQKVCDVGEVSIECASARKRSTRQKLVIKFSLESVVRSHRELGDECDENCREDYMTLSKNKMREASQNAQNIVQATIVRPTGSTGETPSVTLGGVSLQPVEIVAGSLQTLCAKGMVQLNSTCVACPAGSYAVSSSNHCSLCPIGSYQPEDGQIACLPCRTAGKRGSQSCN